MEIETAKEMAEALTLDNHMAIATLGSSGDDVAIELYNEILILERKIEVLFNALACDQVRKYKSHFKNFDLSTDISRF